MLRYLGAFLILFTCLFARRVEIYEDWQPEAAGEAAFQKPAAGTSFYYEIRSSLEEKGFSVSHWDRKAHLPFLLNWKNVKSWTDFKNWLGFGLPRKEPLEADYLIFSNIGVHLRDLNLGRMPKKKMILFMWEPPTVQPEIWDPKYQKHFHKIFTWHDDLVDNVRFFKFHLPNLNSKHSCGPPFEERKFLTLIASRLSSKHPHQIYSEREKLIRFFEERPAGEFDLYGRFWEKRKFRSWKGMIPDKMAVLKNYKFAIAYENSTEPGYITEKLWDCFAAGVVPIYWGAPNVELYIPPDCFIDRRKFECNDSLLAFLQAMTREEWEGYIQRAEAFCKSEAAQKFSPTRYAQTLAEAIDNASKNM